MSDLKAFLKQNKIKRENKFYPATKSITDENGDPILWEIKILNTREVDKIREECTHEIPIKGKFGQYRQTINAGEYLSKLMARSVVYPDLNNKELQDSYGVLTPEDLIREIIDNPVEYNKFGNFIQNELERDDINDKVKQAKN